MSLTEQADNKQVIPNADILLGGTRRKVPGKPTGSFDGTMRRLRYQVASSLDAYIAGANGEFDWIVMDPEIDFGELFNQFDTAVMGRWTFEVILKQGGNGSMAGLDMVVFSQTLQQKDFPAVSIVNTDPAEAIRSLKTKPGKDIWLYGGGELFRTLLDAGLVDTVKPLSFRLCPAAAFRCSHRLQTVRS